MIYDVLGVGFGPSNLAVAIAMQERGYDGKAIFIERSPSAQWQGEMLLDGSDIQNNPVRDLITPVNPQSRFTFINYLFCTGQLLKYLNVGSHYPLRKLYAKYFQWVASHFEGVRYGVSAQQVGLETVNGEPLWSVRCSNNERFLCRNLLVGTGRRLNIPTVLEGSRYVKHLTHYGSAIKGLDREGSVAVLGASQSAVEILLDLHAKGFRQIHSIHRSFSFRLKDTSQFSDEVYFPEFVDYYHDLSSEKRAQLDQQVRQTNYSSADGDVISSLYSKLYEDELDGRPRVLVHRNTRITGYEDRERLVLHLQDVYTEKVSSLEVDLLILATGFLDVGRNGREGLPKLLHDLGETFVWNGVYLNVQRDYKVESVNPTHPALYMNGLCESSHGLGDAGSFSLLSYRARDIVVSLEQAQAQFAN